MFMESHKKTPQQLMIRLGGIRETCVRFWSILFPNLFWPKKFKHTIIGLENDHWVTFQ